MRVALLILLSVSQEVSMMSPDNRLQQLHDKATRGAALSAEEQAQLTAWYAEQDQQEDVLLKSTGASQYLAVLHTQVETALAQLLTVTRHIQQLTANNEIVRREIAVLQRQLTHTTVRQAT
jgi:hypothetical protein